MAHESHFTTEQLTERYEMSRKVRMWVLGAIVVGLLLVLAGLLTAEDPGAHHEAADHASLVDTPAGDVHKVQDHGHDEHADEAHGEHGGHHGPQHHIGKYTGALANFLLVNLYFLTLAMGAMFFMTVHRIGNGGWHTVFKRIPEAMSMWLPFAAVGLLIVGFFGEHLYDWIFVHEIGQDTLIDKKRAYLNVPFWAARGAIFVGVWTFAAWLMRKYSISQDNAGSVEGGLGIFKKMTTLSALFVIFFAISYTLFSIDWIKSLEPHWFSTIFGVYVFAGTFATASAVMGLILHFLRQQGYMGYTNDAHLHDCFKYAFAFTVFWGYIFIAQFLLIWYSNIPEETGYFDFRFAHYKTLFFVKIFACFFLPFIGLMMRNAKRKSQTFVVIGIIMILGHWIDLFVMIMPGAVGEHWHIGLTEIGFFVLYLGLFAFVVLRALSKANLVPIHHPYLDESLHHSTGAV